MTKEERIATVLRWQALPPEAMARQFYEDDADAWMEIAQAIDEIARTGKPAVDLAGSAIVLAADRPEWRAGAWI